jgi:transcription elongation factor GreA
MAKIHLTAEGLNRLNSELEHLTRVRRAEVAERIRLAREEAHGDSGDSTAYEDAKVELALLEQRIAELSHTLAEAEVVEESASHGEVGLGAHVLIKDDDGEQEEYVIVDHLEADPRRGRISETSPVGRALVGHHKGDEVRVETPAGERHITIVEVK